MSKLTKIGLTILVLLLLAAAGGYFIGVPMIEKQQQEAIANWIADFPGELKAESIKTDFLKNSFTITGLKGKTVYLDGSDMYLEIASLSGTGINYKAGYASGRVRLLDSLVLSEINARFTMPLLGEQPSEASAEPFGEQTVVIKELRLKGISGMAEKFIASRQVAEDAAARIANLKRNLDIATSFHVDSMSGTDYVVSATSGMGPVSVRVGSLAYADFSLLNCGPSSFENFSIHALNSEMIVLKKGSAQKISMPNIFKQVIDLAENPQANADEALLELFAKESFVMKGMVMEDFTFKITPTSAPLTISKIGLDLEFGTGKLFVKKTTSGVTIPVDLYRLGSMEMAFFAEKYKKPLELDGEFELEAAQENGKGDIRLTTMQLRDAQLGSFSLVGEMPFQSESVVALLEGNGSLFLKKMSLILEDKLLLNILFAPAPGADAAQMRKAEADSFLASAGEAPHPELDAVVQGLAKILAQPGKLTLSIEPEKALDLNVLFSGAEEIKSSKLNVKVDFVPGK